VIDNGVTGFLHDPEHHAGQVTSVLRLLGNEKLRRTMAAARGASARALQRRRDGRSLRQGLRLAALTDARSPVRLAILAEGSFTPMDAKTAVGVLVSRRRRRRGDRLDARRHDRERVRRRRG
jgi:hypothetical protein